MWWGHGLRYGDFAGFIGIYVGVTGKEMEIKFVFGSISFCFKKSSYTALELLFTTAQFSESCVH